MSDLPPASNKKPDGCVYPRCACNDSFCKEGNPMNSPVDKLKPKCSHCSDSGMAAGFNSWTLTPCWIFCDCQKGLEKFERRRQELGTRAESPDSVVVTTNEQGQAVAVTRQDGEGQILSTIWESPPPPVAADGELIERLNNQYESMYLATAVNHEMYLQAADFIKEISTILQSRSTPPPVAGGDLENRIIALMNIIKERRIDPVLGDVEDDIYNTMKYCLAALQHQDGVVISIEELCLFATYFNVGNEKPESFSRAFPHLQRVIEENKQSLERKNG